MVSCTCNLDGEVQVGNRIRSTATFTNAVADYAPFDPHEVYVTIHDPDGIETTYQYGVDVEVVKDPDEIGVYYVEFELTKNHKWCVKWWAVYNGNTCCTTEECFRAVSTVS